MDFWSGFTVQTSLLFFKAQYPKNPADGKVVPGIGSALQWLTYPLMQARLHEV
jgi:hypothetical protein